MTLEKAKELAIYKWEKLSEDPFYKVWEDEKLKNLSNNCGFCQHDVEERPKSKRACSSCPLDELDICNKEHFAFISAHGAKDKKEIAKVILEIIRNVKI